jgi:malic enzyme
MVANGITLTRARSKIFLVDSQGLVSTSRSSLPAHKAKYAKASPNLKGDASLLDIIKEIQPTGARSHHLCSRAHSRAAMARRAA